MTAARLLALVAAALLAIGGALWLSSQRHLEAASPNGGAFLSALKPLVNDVDQISLRRGDGSATHVLRTAGGWRVQERDYPADASKVRSLLLDLANAKIIEEKTHDPALYPLLGVEAVSGPGAGGIALELRAAKQTFAVIVGKPSGAQQGFARVASQEASYLISPQLNVTAAPANWIDLALFNIAPERVAAVTISLAKAAPYTATRSDSKSELVVSPLPAGRELISPNATASLQSALTDLTISDVTAAALAVAASSQPPAAAHCEVRTLDGLLISIDGRESAENRFIRARVVANPAASTTLTNAARAEIAALTARLQNREFEIPNYKFNALFKPLEELLKPKAAPVKAAPAKSAAQKP